MNKLIAVVGMTGSGKSVITDYLENNGFKKVYFGGLTYEKMKQEGIPYTPEADKMMRVKMREEYGMAAYAILSLPKIKEYIKDSDVVIDGLYSWDEYLVLKNEFPNIILLSVVVDKNIRYDRLKIRPNRNYTSEELYSVYYELIFKDRDLNEIEKLSKGGPICYADYYILNNTTIEDEINSLKNILNKIK